MTAVLFPDATKAQGNVSVLVLAACTPTAPDLSSEIGAGTTVNASCFLFDNGSIVTSTTNKVVATPRLCTTEQFQELGNTTYEVSDLHYVYDPQAADGTDENKVKALLDENAELYLVERLGLAAGGSSPVDYAAGQYVNVYHVRMGKQNFVREGDAEAAVFSVVQAAILIDPPHYGVVVAA